MMKTEAINSIEGSISITLKRDRKDPERVVIKSSRPVHAAKVLIGKTPEQALTIIPMLFNICGIAQSRAALSAMGQQLQIETSQKLEQARDLLVLSETAKEHLLRIFLDWPELFKLERNHSDLSYIGQLVNDFKTELFDQGDAFSLHSKLNYNVTTVESLINNLQLFLQDYVYCCPLEQWLEIQTIDSLREWSEQTDCMASLAIHSICEHGWTSQGFSECEPLPRFNNQQLLERFGAEDAQFFISHPEWKGLCHETTSLSRQFDCPLIQQLHTEFRASMITRLVARLVELARIPQQMRALLQQINSAGDINESGKDSSGIAQVEAARGRLIHRVVIDQDHIDNYQILAPTEWNFHPQGLIKQSLQHIYANDDQELEQLARLIINAIDPCVGYDLRIQ